jgi:hypothetical protein
MKKEDENTTNAGNEANTMLGTTECYLCGYKFKADDAQMEMYGEIVCHGCWNYQLEMTLNMH